jgi:hypothetical protein
MVKVVAMKCRYMLPGLFLLMCLIACKKDLPVHTAVVSIAGKWFITKQSSELFYNGVQINSYTDTHFTTTDFVEYYGDGTGYFSAYTATGPSLSEFTYTLTGTNLMQYTSSKNPGIPETITVLTANNLSVHAVSSIPDPNNSAQLDKEVDDYNYTR